VKLRPLLDERLVIPRLEARDREGVLRELASSLLAGHPSELGAGLVEKLLERESKGTTGVGRGVAVPHCRMPGLGSPVIALGLSKDGVAFDAADGKLSHVFFCLVSPEENPGAGLRILAGIAGLVSGSRGLAAKMLKGATPAEVLEILRAEEEKARA
jgi:PTS system nitrogen regulatory IIA component